MSIQILPASEQDAEDIARLMVLANADDKMFKYVVTPERNATTAQKEEQVRWRTERIRFNIRRTGVYWLKAVDTLTGQLVGQIGVASPKNEKSAWKGEMTETVDEARFKEVMQTIKQKREDLLVDREDFWHVDAMIVRPDYQGRGIGSRLLAEICSRASKANEDVYLEASPAGTKLYLKAGFEKIGEIAILEGEYVLGCMLRKAGST